MTRRKGWKAGRQELEPGRTARSKFRRSGWNSSRSVFLPLIPALLPFCFPALSASAQEPSFRSTSSELVVLPVVVTDKQGRYVGDLATDRFAVFDNGRRVPIELFSNEDTPVTIGLVIDASSSMR